jgi:HlyD family secretion protein
VTGSRLAVSAACLLGVAACNKAQSALPYSRVPVARRDIVVAATASGAIQPLRTLSVKSKASGEILDMPVQTGDEVKRAELLAKVDPRIPRNNLTQAQANVDVAHAQLDNASAQLKRSEDLYQSKSITESDYEAAKLAYTTAKAAVVTAEATLQTAKDAMEDTQVKAPITGTILELDAVLGTVISSPTNDVGGGTVILKMANLDTVQVSALVDETDVGKVRPGTAVTITVDAYPNRQFEGRVLKIEPQAQVTQNVTMFPVDVDILNPGHLLKPGMNTEVEIHTGQRQGVLAVPNAALRTQHDLASAVSVLGLDPNVVQQQLATAATQRPAVPSGADTGLGDGGKLHAAEPPKAGATFTTPDGRTIALPLGVTPAQVRAAFVKMASGAALTPAEQTLLAQVRGQQQAPATGEAAPAGMSGRYIVFTARGGKLTAVPITTGLTDQDYVEVTGGLTERDTVVVLSSGTAR